MAEDFMVDLARLYPPDNPHRLVTAEAGKAKMVASLSRFGQINAIEVEDLGEGFYKIVTGFCRTLAARSMGWTHLRARVVEVDDATRDERMFHENRARIDLSPMEEANVYSRMAEGGGTSINEIARRSLCSASHVSQMLSLLSAPPEVQEALEGGEINKAQAIEIARFRDKTGLQIALANARENGLTATFIKRFREERERSGVDLSIKEIEERAASDPTFAVKSMAKCDWCAEFRDWNETKIMATCDGCRSLIADATAALMAEKDQGK